MKRIADITIEVLAKMKRVGFWRSESEPLLPEPQSFVDDSWDPHYVRSHAVKPAVDFLKHARELGFRVPEMPVLDETISQESR